MGISADYRASCPLFKGLSAKDAMTADGPPSHGV